MPLLTFTREVFIKGPSAPCAMTAKHEPRCGRTNLDPMPEAFGRPLDDEEAEPEAVRPCRIEPKKWLEYSRQLVRWNAFPAVPDLDAKCRSTPAAADEDTPAGQRMIERVAH